MLSESEYKQSPIVVAIENAGKCYHMYGSPADRLKQAALRFTGKRYYEEFWAVRGVTAAIRRGEAVGIVGRNGSGKSTLLQMVAGTLAPTEGSVHVAGRIAALLELGSGFNPEFTGRENVYLNAAILGLTRAQTDERFDAIAGFADIGAFIDQPVKTYSSGMMVRLAFAVQVQVDPDVLIVDEALAVGDALFQKRCFQRLEELRSRGVTLLFVSHDQESVRTLTDRAILLDQGRVAISGTSAEVVLEYRKLLHAAELQWGAAQAKLGSAGSGTLKSAPAADANSSNRVVAITDGQVEETPAPEGPRSAALEFGTLDAVVTGVQVFNSAGLSASVFKPGETIRLRIACETRVALTHLNIGLRIRNKQGVKMYSWGTLNQDISIWSGQSKGEVFWDRSFQPLERIEVEFTCECTLGMNFYEVQAHISQERDRYYRDQRMLHWVDEAAFFQVIVHQDDYFFGGVCDLRMKAAPMPSRGAD
jgi:lipopolysaccharide transport system ATP-binding protein